MTFETNWLQWPFERSSRQFRIYVVEPKAYAPDKHGEVFDAVLRDFFDTASGQVVAGDVSPVIREPVEADLIVFPEAFLAAEDLVQAMKGFATLRLQCCVHVGLRPGLEKPNHLFSRLEIESLLKELKRISGIHTDDLIGFEAWFEKQKPGSNFNLGCMFLVEPKGSVRVCLHPKGVRASIEYSALTDTHMTEANLLSLVTLVPPNSRYMSVTIQPLICADALSLPTDSMIPNPIKAFADSSAANFPRLPADHVDIVSLSLCTPVGEVTHGTGKRRRWKSEFESAFLDAGKRDECFRHHFASFVMANFDEIGTQKGGLSGACMPVPFSASSYPEGVSMWSYGKHGSGSVDGWKCVAGFGVEGADSDAVSKDSKNRPNLICLDDESEPAPHVARALGFTLSRLVRDNPVGGKFPGVTKLDVRAVRDETMNTAEQG
ncbi:hypothetical protein [Cupriavidus sp. H18C2]|uniref:hypothetical protein n=1 Tax=Cupriavidus sp. H18C2 TaxID=3241602 RepID=UPI003BF82885